MLPPTRSFCRSETKATGSLLADLCREQEKGSQRLLVLGNLVP
jgi:hypothetical protein